MTEPTRCPNCEKEITAKETLQLLLDHQGAIIEAIEQIMDGETPSDFMLSFPIVRKVFDIKTESRSLLY